VEEATGVSAGWKGIADLVLAGAGIVIDSDGVAAIPYGDSDGSLLRTRFRSGTRAWWGPGEDMSPFGLEQLPWPDDCFPSFCALLVTEGESDALAAREHFAFHGDAVAVHYDVLGVPGATCFRPEWRVVCEPYDVLYAVGDGDAAGQKFAFDIRRIVPWARPVVCPEGRDLRDLLQEHGIEPVLGLLRESDRAAEAEYALLHAPDLETARAWLEGQR
jgi:hypothetical protein